MRHAALLVVLIMAAASPAAAQSCATLGGQVDCRGAPTRQPATSPQPSRPGRDVDVQGSAETTVSNRGASTTLNNKVIDSHGIMEFGFFGSTKTPCRRPGYGTLCE
jgi:hypothetical protein